MSIIEHINKISSNIEKRIIIITNILQEMKILKNLPYTNNIYNNILLYIFQHPFINNSKSYWYIYGNHKLTVCKFNKINSYYLNTNIPKNVSVKIKKKVYYGYDIKDIDINLELIQKWIPF